MREELENKFSYRYPYGYLQEIPAKISISELKKQAMNLLDAEQEEAQYLIVQKESIPLVPEFMRQEKTELKSAARGTAYHRVLECIAYEKTDNMTEIQEQIQEMLREGKIDQETADSVREQQIFWFVSSNLGKRMRKAEEEKKLWREQQFVMSIPAQEQNSEWGTEAQILVQGIIDAFFEETDGLILVDYKTDYVEKGQEQELVKKYQKQLWYYARALERVWKKTVKEAYLYSFGAGKALPVDVQK